MTHRRTGDGLAIASTAICMSTVEPCGRAVQMVADHQQLVSGHLLQMAERRTTITNLRSRDRVNE